MTKRDFILIAGVIRALAEPNTDTCVLEEADQTLVAWRFAEALRATNARFDGEKFLKACGASK
jgi:hypothetical protein